MTIDLANILDKIVLSEQQKCTIVSRNACNGENGPNFMPKVPPLECGDFDQNGIFYENGEKSPGGQRFWQKWLILHKWRIWNKWRKPPGSLESADFGENGKIFPEGWLFKLAGKSGPLASGDFGDIGMAIFAKMAKFGKNGEFGTNCKKSPESW